MAKNDHWDALHERNKQGDELLYDLEQQKRAAQKAQRAEAQAASDERTLAVLADPDLNKAVEQLKGLPKVRQYLSEAARSSRIIFRVHKDYRGGQARETRPFVEITEDGFSLTLATEREDRSGEALKPSEIVKKARGAVKAAGGAVEYNAEKAKADPYEPETITITAQTFKGLIGSFNALMLEGKAQKKISVNNDALLISVPGMAKERAG